MHTITARRARAILPRRQTPSTHAVGARFLDLAIGRGRAAIDIVAGDAWIAEPPMLAIGCRGFDEGPAMLEFTAHGGPDAPWLVAADVTAGPCLSAATLIVAIDGWGCLRLVQPGARVMVRFTPTEIVVERLAADVPDGWDAARRTACLLWARAHREVAR